MKNARQLAVRVITVALFVFLVWFGLVRASYQPLWNDETYSLLSSIEGRSYGQLAAGDMGGVEGNNTPLFYLLQKLQCDASSYHVPRAWVDGKWEREDILSQVFLRIQPVVFVALAISALFYYFAVRYSPAVGFYGVLVALSSFMLWAHWTESRPYALWFSLTMAQTLLLLELLKEGAQARHKAWGWLALVHGLLAVTTTISVLQIVMCSVVLWCFSCRRWQAYLTMTVLPVALGLFYYFTFTVVSKFSYYFVDGPVALISANIPKDRFFIIFIFALFFGGQRWWKRDRAPLATEGKYIVFLGLMLLAYGAVLIQFKALESVGHKGFQVPARYFMALTPVGIVGTTLFSAWLVRMSDPKFVRPAVIAVLVVFLVFRIYRTSQFFHWGLPF